MTDPLQDRDKALSRMNGNLEIYEEILKLLVATVPAKLAELKVAQRAADMETVERVAHSIKGGAASVGATQLQHSALALEEAATDQSGADVPRRMTRLLEDFERLRALVQGAVSE